MGALGGFWEFSGRRGRREKLCPAHARRRSRKTYWIAVVSPPSKKSKTIDLRETLDGAERTLTVERTRKIKGCGLTSAIQNVYWLRKRIFSGTLYPWQARTPAADEDVDPIGINLRGNNYCLISLSVL